MKKIYILPLICILLTNCVGILDEDPKSFISKTNFYRNESDAFAALFGTYGTLGNGSFPTIWFMALLECRSDYANGRGSQVSISNYEQPLDASNQVRAWNSYNEIYQGINRANAVLDNVSGIQMNENTKKIILAEAKFLRAFFYSNLVKYWGGVPIRDKEFTNFAQIAAPRASKQVVWDFIIKDLTEAIPDMANNFPLSQAGRATSWSAKMLLADSYLNLENWQAAANLAEDVIKNGPFSFVDIDEPNDFNRKLYGIDVTSHTENIWSIQHSETNGNSVPNFLHRTQPGGYGVGGVFAWIPVMTSFLGTWDKKDFRQIYNTYTFTVAPSGQIIPLPAPSPLFKKYQDGSAASGSAHRNNIPVYRLPEAYLIYAEASAKASNSVNPLAVERLNAVRRRAYGFDPLSPSSIDYPSNLPVNQFIDLVIQERGYEFILEMKRWNDLLRTGKAKEVIQATGKVWNDVSLLFPIPVDEINNNPAMTKEDQNPGY
ncbi:RagB/SusD family nutrient uptake outer membrane protein [Algoriphagus sp.]|uniref:RagB/SusD family nutrient uptake outer membrane protein n=1 Tax=Algoriphagus sp. TaxID=1872435 RepID=UPI00271EED67|nr:RagB/SusD family nutrient uptake outer membrane protein [Algoriphagus sp.]MDO8966295.1 RagB/SusD family nutrient uptake outer membrane protein [Algoriphagus sp.]MDP3198278.1 RagB/SusD family nutrient uptake outer membrane protein [Algoriphagus sp.]